MSVQQHYNVCYYHCSACQYFLSLRRRILTSSLCFFNNKVRYWPYLSVYKLMADISQQGKEESDHECEVKELGKQLSVGQGEKKGKQTNKKKTLVYYTINCSRNIQTNIHAKAFAVPGSSRHIASAYSGHQLYNMINRTGMILTYCEKMVLLHVLLSL